MEYKSLYFEELKYKEKLDELIQKDVVSSEGEELMKF